MRPAMNSLLQAPQFQQWVNGYSICLVFLKLSERIYAPLTAGLLSPIGADAKLEARKRSQLDRLIQRVVNDLDALVQAVGLKGGMSKFVTSTITV